MNRKTRLTLLLWVLPFLIACGRNAPDTTLPAPVTASITIQPHPTQTRTAVSPTA